MELNLKTFEQISLFWITPRLSYSHHLGSPKRLVSGRGLKYHAKMIKTYLDGSGSTDRPAPSFFPVLSWRFVNLNKNLLHLNITLKLALAKKWCLKYKNREFAYVSFTTINDVKTANKGMSVTLQNYIDSMEIRIKFDKCCCCQQESLYFFIAKHFLY